MPSDHPLRLARQALLCGLGCFDEARKDREWAHRERSTYAQT